MTFTPNMPVGHYWLRQDRRNSDGSMGKGLLEIIYISGETNYRRKPVRLVVGKGWSETLESMIGGIAAEWKLAGPIAEPDFDTPPT